MDIWKELKSKVEKESRSPEDLYMFIKQAGALMFFSKKWSDEQIIAFCAAILALRNKLTAEQN